MTEGVKHVDRALVTRETAVAGLFYPANASQLTNSIHSFLKHTSAAGPTLTKAKALIVPHAGYIYSGQVAAYAYRQLQTESSRITRVVLIGPAHQIYFRGLAIVDKQHFQTPLGLVNIDIHSSRSLLDFSQVSENNLAHAKEHSIEVQLPFLQYVLEDFEIIPLLVGDASVSEIERVIDSLWGGDECLIIVSSDLSHYLVYENAQVNDAKTCKAIEAFDEDNLSNRDACGQSAIKALLRCAKSRKLSIKTLALCNSGDTAGDKERVVGYGAWCFS